MQAGIATVTQETTLVPDLSVAENVFLGPAQAAALVRDRLAGDPRTRAGGARAPRAGACGPRTGSADLRPDQLQMVEIARALSMDARVVILDEPTSALTDDEVATLFDAVRALREQGVAIAFVSHRMNEVFDLVDRVTVLRDGSTVGTGPIENYDPGKLIGLMIGRELGNLDLGEHTHVSANPVLRVRGFNVPGRVHDAALEVEKGEIVGLAGLVGAGRSALLEGAVRDATRGRSEGRDRRARGGDAAAPGRPCAAASATCRRTARCSVWCRT